MKFEHLVGTIKEIHQELAIHAGKAVNICLTTRNWLIGWHIQEFEQHGEDRAQYGGNLLAKLAVALEPALRKCYTERYLRLCRQFYGDEFGFGNR